MQHSASLMTTDSDEGKVSDNVAYWLKFRPLSSKGDDKILVAEKQETKDQQIFTKMGLMEPNILLL
jgi:hypothetical protein